MRRRTKPIRRNLRLRFVLIAAAAVLLAVHACAAALRRANSLGRRCSPELIDGHRSSPLRIVMVSFSSERKGTRRSFKGVAEVVAGNKRAYAARKGYDLIDAGDLVPPAGVEQDPCRPISSLFLRLGFLERCGHGGDESGDLFGERISAMFYLGVWNLAVGLASDVCRSSSQESVIWSVIGHADFDESPDLILTEDINGVNSGVFFIRRSNWSENFLNIWWNQTSFIRFGSTKSGDNAAFKHLIDNLPPDELREHVRISPMQCLFNSYPWFPSWKSVLRLFTSPFTAWKGAYSDGDFIAHLAGIDEKKEWVAKILRQVESKLKRRNGLF